MHVSILWICFLISGVFISFISKNFVAFPLVIVLLGALYFLAALIKKPRIELLSKRKKSLLLRNIIYVAIFFVWGIGVGAIFHSECPIQWGIHDWIPVREVKNGLLVQQKGSSGSCGTQYFFCMSGKCPKLFVNLTLEASQKGDKVSFTVKKITPPRLADIFQLLLFEGNNIKERIYYNLRDYYGESVGGLYISMLFGGEYVPKEIDEQMKHAGLLHLVAVSGVNITVFLSIVATILTLFPRVVRISGYFCFLVIFIAISGLSPPTVRAIIAAFILNLLQAFGLRLSSKVSVPIVMTVCLLLFSEFSQSISFILTSVAIMTVVYICPLVTKFVKEKVKNTHVKFLLIKIGECFCVELAINVCLYVYFRELSLWGFVTSLFADPVVDFFSLLGYLSMPLVLVGGVVGRLFSVLPAMYCYLLVIILKAW